MYETLDYVSIVRDTGPPVLRAEVEPYVDDPVQWVNDFIIRFHPDYPNLRIEPEQEEILRSCAEFNRVSCRSGHGIGKTAALAWLVLWFLATRPDSLVVITGPKADQIRDTIWTEIGRWLQYSPMARDFKQDAEKLYHRRYKGTWFCVWRTAKEPENIAGFHNKYMLFVIDEASGVHELILDKMEAATTAIGKENRLVMCSNPTQTRGTFFESHTTRKDMYKTLHYSAEKSALVDHAHLVRMKKKYGENSDFYQYSVRGEFPSGNPEALIQLSACLEAVARQVSTVKGAPFELGVDVAHQGNDLTVITTRWGNKVFPQSVFSKYDTVQVAAEVISTVQEFRKFTEYTGPVRIKVDYGFGHGVIDILKRDKENRIVVIPVHFGGEHDPRYADAATQMWCEIKDQLPYIELPNDENLIAELSSRRTVNHPAGLPKIEDKERYKAHFGSSPDRADSLVLAFTRSAEKKRVIGTFSKTNPKLCRDFKINWRRMIEYRAQVYGTFWQDDDLSTHILLCLWDGYNGHLYLWDELMALSPRPDTIMPRLNLKVNMQIKEMGANMVFLDIKKFLWYGNNLMFGMTERAHSFSDRDGSANSFMTTEYGIIINPNLYMDLPGSISLVNQLFTKQAVTVHTRCEETILQLEGWVIENGRPGDEDCGLCKALCNIISLLHQWGRLQPAAFKKLKPYSDAKMNAVKRIQAEDKSAQFPTVDKYADFKKEKVEARTTAGPMTKG
jgi:hypothetical protein